MKLRVSDDFFALFPEAVIAVIAARGIDNHTRAEEVESLTGLLASAQRSLVAAVRVPVTEEPRIHCWREAYRAFGAKPKDNPSSIENLARRTLKGEPLRHINKIVDLYNYVSLAHYLPAGGEDLDRIEGDIVLTRATADEPKVRLLGESEERAPKPGEVIYKDDVGAICRRWNWKEAERTKLTEETTNAVLVLEAIPPISRGELEAAAAELSRRVQERCGGESAVSLLDRLRPSADLDLGVDGAR
jgi:DNA/RNA-binding domain of Phe-tRNA-synthetase-like protein